jgi:three-Cys-motif partner protein
MLRILSGRILMKPKTILWPLEPHSIAKHRILRRYLDGWLPIMSNLVGQWAQDGRGRLALIDGFCGPGEYAGGEDGSPIIMLKAFLEHGHRAQIQAELIYIFIDEDRGRIDHLDRAILNLAAAQPGRQFPPQVKVQTIAGRYEDVFSGALDDLVQKGMRPAPTFAFIDPFGYSDASMDLAGRLLTFARCEALIYMPLPFVARFVGRKGQEAAMTNLFGTERWQEAIDLEGEERREFLHDVFRDQLVTEEGDRLVRSFDIPTSRGNGYTLFFTTAHEKGLEVMKDAMWSVDPIEGRRFRDTTRTDQLVIFDDKVDTAPLLVQLREHFGTHEFSIEDATSFTLRETAFKKGHLKTLTLAPAERAGVVKVLNARKRARTYPRGTRMRFENGA